MAQKFVADKLARAVEAAEMEAAKREEEKELGSSSSSLLSDDPENEMEHSGKRTSEDLQNSNVNNSRSTTSTVASTAPEIMDYRFASLANSAPGTPGQISKADLLRANPGGFWAKRATSVGQRMAGSNGKIGGQSMPTTKRDTEDPHHAEKRSDSPRVGEVVKVQTNLGWENVIVKRKYLNGKYNILFEDGEMMLEVMPRIFRPSHTPSHVSLTLSSQTMHAQSRTATNAPILRPTTLASNLGHVSPMPSSNKPKVSTSTGAGGSTAISSATTTGAASERGRSHSKTFSQSTPKGAPFVMTPGTKYSVGAEKISMSMGQTQDSTKFGPGTSSSLKEFKVNRKSQSQKTTTPGRGGPNGNDKLIIMKSQLTGLINIQPVSFQRATRGSDGVTDS